MQIPSTSRDDQQPRSGNGTFLDDVLRGLRRRPRRLPAKYFYDERGSRLFDQICELPEYYLTRTELAILRQYGPDIAEALGRHCYLVELGSGSSLKTRVLLDHLSEPCGYAPIDISRDHLHRAAAAIADDYPELEVVPIWGDYSGDDEVPLPTSAPASVTVFYPGSSIGNFHHPEAVRLLAKIASLCGRRGQLLIGIDLKKDPRTIERAYNDSRGVTAEFNRNILRRINRELGGDFVPEDWYHHAFYQPGAGRVEMHLVSRRRQQVGVGGERFSFEEGESIRTECSYKYTVEELVELARAFSVEAVWTDAQEAFAVVLLKVASQGVDRHA